MLKIKKEKFTSRELQNGFKFVKVDDKFLKITKAVRTKEKYVLICGKDNVTLDAFKIDYVFETEDRDIKYINEDVLDIDVDKVNIIEEIVSFDKWYKKQKNLKTA